MKYDNKSKHTFLRSAGYFPFKPTDNPDSVLKDLAVQSNRSKKFCLYGKIFNELSESNRYIPNGVGIRYKFIAGNDSFNCMGSKAITTTATTTPATTPKLKILKGSLFVRHIQLSPKIFTSINKTLQLSNVIFPIKRRSATLLNLSTAQSHFILDNVYLSPLPDQIIFGLVDHNAFNGDYELNPLAFKNNGLNYITVYYNNRPYPSVPYTPNYSNDSYEREFYDLFNEQGMTTGIGYLDITYKSFKTHSNLYALNFNSDFSNTLSEYICLSKEGNLRIELRFDSPLTKALKLIVIGRFDSNIEIDRNRNIIVDY